MAADKDKIAKAEEKQKRLSEALRANLHKRKSQSRGRKKTKVSKSPSAKGKDT